MSEDVSVRFTLLDQQLVDSEGLPFGRIDDLDLTFPEDGPPAVAALLTGTQALGDRLGGRGGRWLAAISARFRPPSGRARATRIDAELIAELEPLVRLSAPLRDLADVACLERWLASHAIAPLPGAGDAAE
jgi:hypothetical protein